MNKTSVKRLATAHPDLADIAYAVDAYYPIMVLEGHRSKDRQNMLFDTKKSKVQYPNSKHNYYPSLAIDIAPNPIPHEWGEKWVHRVKFYEMQAIFRYEAKRRNIVTRWGGDWDGDYDYTDNKFNDLVHVELVSVRGAPIKSFAKLPS